MLDSFIKTTPLTKFILIQDSLKAKGTNFFDYILQDRWKKSSNNIPNIHVLQFQHNSKLNLPNGVNKIDLIGDFEEWNETNSNIVKSLTQSECIIFIDSLAHMVLKYTACESYRLINLLKNAQSVKQIVCLLHTDILEDPSNSDWFEQLSTLSITVLTQNRVHYCYLKPGGKVTVENAEYAFVDSILRTTKLEVIDPKMLQNEQSPISPENLSTFKISLEDNEKQQRDALILPFLPQEHIKGPEATIHYEFDAADDWDQEDPDDDLDF